jgi:hypothetical protein
MNFSSLIMYPEGRYRVACCGAKFFAPQGDSLYSGSMNKRSVKKRPAKASRNQVARKAASRQLSGKRKPTVTLQPKTDATAGIAISAVAFVAAQQAAIRPLLRAHKYRVGQTVLYTSSPVSRPGASGSYKVVKLLPSDGDDYQYRIKNSGEAFERVAKESQLELEH